MTNPADGKPPVSLHPAFPAIVALWFAALLGLGSMVVPVALLESVVTTTGLAAIIPGAEPPLGFTARGLIALIAAVAGALAGLVLARRVAQSRRPDGSARLSRIAGVPRNTDAATPRPINAHEELGSEGLLAAVSRRRSLSVTDETRPSDFLAHAPVPGGEDTDAQPATFAPTAAMFVMEQPEEPEAIDPLDLADELDPADLDLAADAHLWADAGDEPVTLDSYADEEVIAEAAIEDVEMDEDRDMDDDQALRPSAVIRPEFRPHAAPQGEAGAAAPVDQAAEGFDQVGLPQLVEQLGLSMARRRHALEQQAALAAVAPKLELEPEPAPAPLPPAEAMAAIAAEMAAATPAVAFANPDLQVARPEEAAQAMAAYFGKPAAIATPREPAAKVLAPDTAAADIEVPAFVAPDIAAHDIRESDAPAATVSGQPASFARPADRSTGFAAFMDLPDDDADDEDDLAASFTLPLRAEGSFPAFARPVVAEDLADEEPESMEDESGEADEGFSSLLSLNNPFAARPHAFVRVDETDNDDGEPVAGHVVFPGQDHAAKSAPALVQTEGSAQRLFDRPGTGPATSRSASGEMDDALRSALAKLQRMSGAA